MIFTFSTFLGLPILPSFFLGVLVTVGLGVLIELLVYKPLSLRDRSSNVIMISSIGAMIIVVNVIAMLYGNEIQIINPDISETITFGDLIFTHTQILQLVISICLITLFLIFLKFSRFGIITRAMRDDPTLCTVFGLDLYKMRALLFALSSFFAAVGGGLIAYDVGMDPYVGMPMLLNAVVALIVGGIGRFEAPILGGFIIGLLQSLSVYAFSARWQDAITFTLLIVFLIFRPQGLLGEKGRQV
jgi:branched-chain amino acid transport system permease protein